MSGEMENMGRLKLNASCVGGSTVWGAREKGDLELGMARKDY